MRQGGKKRRENGNDMAREAGLDTENQGVLGSGGPFDPRSWETYYRPALRSMVGDRDSVEEEQLPEKRGRTRTG